MKKFMLTVVGFLASSMSAYAADIQSPSPNWNGPYIGLAAGVSDQDAEWTDLADDWFNGSDDFGSTSAIFGVYAGYNFDQGPFVFGLEGDFSGALNSDKGSGPTYDEKYFNDLNWLGSLRARVGMPFDSTLLYVTGGAALAGVRNEMTSVTYPDEDFDSTDSVVFGYVAGAGIEFAAFDNAMLRLEGLYYNFGSKKYEQDQDPGQFMRIGNEIFVGRVGLTFAF